MADHSDTNLMSVANLAVCFGPTLMRPPEETLAAIIDIKFCNVIVEILITNYDKVTDRPTCIAARCWHCSRRHVLPISLILKSHTAVILLLIRAESRDYLKFEPSFPV